MKPVIVEKDGVRVAVAVQVNIKQCNHRDAGSPQLPSQSSVAGPSWLEGTCEAVGLAADGCVATVRLLAFGAGRALLLGINVLGLLGAKLARAYLLGWASMGGTHRRLSRNISPWLTPHTPTLTEPRPPDFPALVAEVLEMPANIPSPRRDRMTALEALTIQRAALGLPPPSESSKRPWPVPYTGRPALPTRRLTAGDEDDAKLDD